MRKNLIALAGGKDRPKRVRLFAGDIVKVLEDQKVTKISMLPGNATMEMTMQVVNAVRNGRRADGSSSPPPRSPSPLGHHQHQD